MPESPSDLDTLPETALLRRAATASALTAADLAVAAGMSTAAVYIALSGQRHRGGEVRRVVPSDEVLVKLSWALGISPESLRAVGRERAAALLAAAARAERSPSPATTESEEVALALVAGRSVLARRVLAAFSTEELRDELERREAEEDGEHAAWRREVEAEAEAELRAARGLL